MARNGRSTKPRSYHVHDGKLMLILTEDEGGWFCVTSPMDPALITQARNIREAFEMAYDALRALAVSRADPNRWDVPAKKTRQARKHRAVVA
jgi:hypothetical protein